MKFNLDNPLMRRILSIVIAIGLFTFVNYENSTRFQSNNPTDGASITSSEIIANLPIEVNIDTERYFVSGIPDSATLRIEGPQAILFQTIATQNFTIATPDLNEYGEGTHAIDLEVHGLSNDITASISPANVSLTIEEKMVEEHGLEIQLDDDLQLAEGYEVLEPSVSVDTVTISGAATTMSQIDRVVVEVSSDDTDIKNDILSSAQVLVLDANENLLNVNVSPAQVEILAPVIRTQKEVPIVLRAGNGRIPGYSYDISLSNAEADSITVRGEPEAIAELANLVIDVNFNGMTESSLKVIPIENLPEGIEEVSRDEIEVLIEVTNNNRSNSIQD